jgi:hypothetical protein
VYQTEARSLNIKTIITAVFHSLERGDTMLR